MPEINTVPIIKGNKQWENFSSRDSWERYQKTGYRAATKEEKTISGSGQHQVNSHLPVASLSSLISQTTEPKSGDSQVDPHILSDASPKDWRKGKHPPRHAMQPPSLITKIRQRYHHQKKISPIEKITGQYLWWI